MKMIMWTVEIQILTENMIVTGFKPMAFALVLYHLSYIWRATHWVQANLLGSS